MRGESGRKGFVSLSLLLLSFSIVAAEENCSGYFARDKVVKVEGHSPLFISKVRLSEMAVINDSHAAAYARKLTIDDLPLGAGDVLTQIKDLIAIGEKIYELVKKGKPVVTTSYAPVSVLPKDGNQTPVDVMDMENWSEPAIKRFKIEYMNSQNRIMASFIYTVSAIYGGSYNEKGKYLTGVQISPEKVYLGWGYNFSATSKLVSIANHGSKKDPIAGASLQINYRLESLFQTFDDTVGYHITGNGSIRAL